MIDCGLCDHQNDMTKECKKGKPIRFDIKLKIVTPIGDCRHYSAKVFQI